MRVRRNSSRTSFHNFKISWKRTLFNAYNTLMNGQPSVPQTCYSNVSCCSPLHHMLGISLRNFFNGSLKTKGQYRRQNSLSASNSEICGNVHYYMIMILRLRWIQIWKCNNLFLLLTGQKPSYHSVEILKNLLTIFEIYLKRALNVTYFPCRVRFHPHPYLFKGSNRFRPWINIFTQIISSISMLRFISKYEN